MPISSCSRSSWPSASGSTADSGGWAGSSELVLLARLDLLRRRLGRGLAKGHVIDLAPGQHAEAHRLQAQRGELALELRRRNAMALDLAIRVDHDDEAVRPDPVTQVPEECVRRL